MKMPGVTTQLALVGTPLRRRPLHPLIFRPPPKWDKTRQNPILTKRDHCAPATYAAASPPRLIFEIPPFAPVTHSNQNRQNRRTRRFSPISTTLYQPLTQNRFSLRRFSAHFHTFPLSHFPPD